MSKPMTREQLSAHRDGHDRSNSWWMNDARGIPVARVCDACEDAVRAQYKPEIFDAGKYDSVVEEQIEPDY